MCPDLREGREDGAKVREEMSRTIQVEVLLGIIDQAQTTFSVEALKRAPDGGHAAYYHHGVIRGMEAVKENVLNRMKEEDDREKKPVVGGGQHRAY
jgi:hypothetical protein